MNGWSETTLGDLCKMYQSKTIGKKDMTADGAFPVFGANGVMGHYHLFNHEKPQLVIGCRGACGTVHITEPKSWITGNSMVIQPELDDADLNYLKYFFLGPANLKEIITGAAQPQITQAALKPLKVPLPPLEEQKRIVAVLDQAFAALDRARANAETNLADIDDLSLSASKASFDGIDAEQMPLGELCEIYQPKTISAKQMKPDGKYIVFGANGPIGRYDQYNHEERQLLITCRGATCGSINTSEPNSWITGNAMVVRPKDDRISVDYLEQFFRGAMKWKNVITGAAQPQITRQSLAPTLVSVPPISVQIREANKLKRLQEKLSETADLLEKKLTDIDDLRQSILQKAFAGELS